MSYFILILYLGFRWGQTCKELDDFDAIAHCVDTYESSVNDMFNKKLQQCGRSPEQSRYQFPNHEKNSIPFFFARASGSSRKEFVLIDNKKKSESQKISED